MVYLEVSHLAFSYEEERVLEEISFTLEAGELTILTGENGAAKSTLLKNILGLLPPDTGTVTWAKKNVKGKKLSIGYLPQTISSFNSGFPSTVKELVASGRFQQGKWFSRLTAEDDKQVQRALESVGMWDFRHRQIGDLSGGQKQRICLARIFAADPDVFVLDEPTTGMDKESRQNFLNLLKHSCRQHKKAVLMVTHHDDEILYGDQHIHLERKEDSPWKCFSMASCKRPSSPQV